jgi:predicted GH43/DUF377 family glycosyl hydrolase
MINNFAKIVLEAGGSIHPLIVDGALTKGTGLLNPSLFLYNNEMYLNIRHVQYTLYHSENNQYFQTRWGPLSYLHPEHDRTLTTVNYFGKLEGTTPIVAAVDTSKLDVPPIWEFVGLEDARVMVWDEKIWLCGVRRDTTTNGKGRMEMSRIEPTENGWVETERYRIDTPFSNDTYCEKNWVPINDRPYHFVKWSNPVEVVKVDLTTQADNGLYLCEQVHLSDTVHPLPRDIRGGSNVIPWGENYLMLTHEVDLFHTELKQKDAFYYHRFLLMSRDFEVIGWSDAFNFMTGHIEFACGLSESHGEVYITFGFQDNSAYLLKSPKEVIERCLNRK